MLASTSQARASLLYAGLCVSILGLGLWHYAPSLRLGLFSDDYLAMAMADGGYGPPRHPLDLFNFAAGTPEDTEALRRVGVMPWWAPTDFRIAFMRPLSSALVHLDRTLFGDALWAYHAHSIAVWVALVLAAACLYRRFFSVGIAAIAVAVFAFDESQTGPVVWLCNRGGAYAVLFSVLGLFAHLCAREDGERVYAWLSAGCIAVALLFGEWALPMLAYLFAYEVLGARDAWRRRVLALLPAALLGACFVGVRALLGYGARSSGVYVDPGEDPMGFLLLLLHRVPVLAADMLVVLPASWWDGGSPWRNQILSMGLFSPPVWAKMPGWRAFHVALSLLAVATFGLALRLTWRGLSVEERAHLRWLLLGSLLSLTPVVGAFPSSRLTLSACVGFAPAFALVLRQIGRALLRADKLGALRFLSLYALGALLLWLQVVKPLQTDLRPMVNDFKTTGEWVRAAPLDQGTVSSQRVFVIGAVEFTTTFFFHGTWSYFNQAVPRSYYPLSMAPFAHDLFRTAENAFLLTPLGGGFLGSPPEVHYRPRARSMHLSEVVELPGVRIEVTEVLNGSPVALRLTFERSLDDPSHVFLTPKPQGLSPIVMPPVGQTLRIPRGASPNWAALQWGLYEQRLGPFPEFLQYTPTPFFVGYRPAG